MPHSSQYMRVYYLYELGVHIGSNSLKNFNPISANLQTWSVHSWQLSPGIQPLVDAWDYCGCASNPIFIFDIEHRIVQEILRQLYCMLLIWLAFYFRLTTPSPSASNMEMEPRPSLLPPAHGTRRNERGDYYHFC